MLKSFVLLFKFVWFHPLNYNNRLAALWRVLSFQIASRIISAPILLPFVNSTKLFMKSSMSGVTGNWYCGLQEYEEMGFLLHILQPDDLFIDVGANVGSYSILAGACEGVKVIAFEPIPQAFSWLKKNIQINSLENKIQCMNIGLAEKKGNIYFSSNFDTLNHVISEKENSASMIKVDTYQLDEIVQDECPAVIKIDVEGYEFQVLNGAKRILNNSSLIGIIVELNGSGKRYGVEDIEIHKLLLNKNFEAFKYDPLNRKLVPLIDNFSIVSNTLYLRNLSEVQKRISKKSIFKLANGKKI